MSPLRRVWRWLTQPVARAPAQVMPSADERVQARRRLVRIQQRLDADFARLSREIEDGWRRGNHE